MKEKFKLLNIYQKTFIVSAFISLIIFILMIPLIIFGYGEYSFGLILGEFINYMSYMILGFIEKRNSTDKKITTLMVVTIILRIVILALVATLVGFMYYRHDIKVFNIFTLIGGYMIPLIVFIVISIKERNN